MYRFLHDFRQFIYFLLNMHSHAWNSYLLWPWMTTYCTYWLLIRYQRTISLILIMLNKVHKLYTFLPMEFLVLFNFVVWREFILLQLQIKWEPSNFNTIYSIKINYWGPNVGICSKPFNLAAAGKEIQSQSIQNTCYTFLSFKSNWSNPVILASLFFEESPMIKPIWSRSIM